MATGVSVRRHAEDLFGRSAAIPSGGDMSAVALDSALSSAVMVSADALGDVTSRVCD